MDVIEYHAGLCGLPQAIGASFDIGGPDVMTYREMIERVGTERGKRPLIVEVPVLETVAKDENCSLAGSRRST